MVITTVSASISRKLNLGDFNSIDVQVGAWAQLEPGETMEQATRELQARCSAAIGEVTRPFMKVNPVNVRTQERFAGRPVIVTEGTNGNGHNDMAEALNIK